jgi:CRP/FNR family transcriptional regulator, dissimilatory nitrate respiration regulator
VRELDLQAVGSGTERFIAYLLQQGRDRTSLVMRLPAAKAEIASHLNLTPEHFSRILHDLATAGLLQIQGRTITVPDLSRLQQAKAKH